MNPTDPANSITRMIVAEARKSGELSVGFTPLTDEDKKGFDEEIQPSAGRYQSAVSLAFPLSLGVLRTVSAQPTVLYKQHYQQANYLLDRTSLRVAQVLELQGYAALPLPASVYTSRKEQRAHLGHREIAFLAGIGWWGRCNLIVHPRFGAGIRLATILTDLELPAAPPLANNCGDCRACREACPAQAIGEDISEFNRSACFAQVREFERKVIGVGICGVCVRSCREARQKTSKSENLALNEQDKPNELDKP